ncbi:MAG: hypothetical protein V4448_01675 [Pseudomonadota bacterium]
MSINFTEGFSSLFGRRKNATRGWFTCPVPWLACVVADSVLSSVKLGMPGVARHAEPDRRKNNINNQSPNKKMPLSQKLNGTKGVAHIKPIPIK